VQPRTFPVGQSVEVLPTETLARACGDMVDAADREHVLPWIYRRPGEFSIVNVAAGRDRSHIRLCVDTEDDWRLIAAIFDRMERESWMYGIEELLSLHDSVVAARRAPALATRL
jgi:spore coat polysaccharide biosynthesis protein SpsF